MYKVDRDQIQLLLRVARWYYLDEESQNEIANRIGYSRASVSRLLTQARELGVVKFVIAHPVERQLALERALVSKFGLRAARVADSDEETSTATAVARAGADVLVESCKNATILATSAGTTIDALVQELPYLNMRDLVVVQMIGALSRTNPLVDTPEITRRLADRLGGDFRQMPSPLIVASAELAQALQQEEAVATALGLASQADVALMGIGAINLRGVPGPIFQGWFSHEEGQELLNRHAVGHMSGHHFDAEGRHIETQMCGRMLTVPLDRLVDIKTVIGVATGPHKVAAIKGALRGHLIDVLVTDADTAKGVLRDDQ